MALHRRAQAGTQAGGLEPRSHAQPLVRGRAPAAQPAAARLSPPPSHVERTLETFCNMNLEMQETQNISKINKQASTGWWWWW